jgi:hypothetical protein
VGVGVIVGIKVGVGLTVGVGEINVSLGTAVNVGKSAVVGGAGLHEAKISRTNTMRYIFMRSILA